MNALSDSASNIEGLMDAFGAGMGTATGCFFEGGFCDISGVPFK
jgi:hypothetical protein